MTSQTHFIAGLLLTSILLVLAAQPSKAQPMEIEVCNEGERTVWMVVAEPEKTSWAIPTGNYSLKGWFKISPRACVNPKKGVFNYTSIDVVYAALVARDSEGRLYSVHADPGRTTGNIQTSTRDFCVTNEDPQRTATLGDHTDCPSGWYPLRFPVAFLGNKHIGRRSSGNNTLRLNYAVYGELNRRLPTQQESDTRQAETGQRHDQGQKHDRGRRAVDDLKVDTRRSFADPDTQVLVLLNHKSHPVSFDLKCYTRSGNSKVIPVTVPVRGPAEVGFVQGWSGNFVAGERCEAYYRDELIWTYEIN